MQRNGQSTLKVAGGTVTRLLECKDLDKLVFVLLDNCVDSFPKVYMHLVRRHVIELKGVCQLWVITYLHHLIPRLQIFFTSVEKDTELALIKITLGSLF